MQVNKQLLIQKEYIRLQSAAYAGQKLYGQLRKTALSLTQQAMHNQFKRPYAGSVRELYYIYRKT